MTDPLDEYPLEHSPEPPAASGRRQGSNLPLIAGVLVVVALAAAVAFVLWRRAAPASVTTSAPTAGARLADPARAPLGPGVDPAEVPPIDEADGFVRDLLRGLSSGPELAAWLATDGLIRSFVASLDNVAGGTTPARRLSALAPVGPFRVLTSRGRLTIDPRSFARYDSLADTVASIDPASLARIYSTLKPRLQDAYRELGHPDGDIDAAVEQALVRLLQTPLHSDELRVVEGGVSYRFEDASLEALSPAQKQLLRMGPRNVRLIQRELWALGRELGIPSDRLPAPKTPQE